MQKIWIFRILIAVLLILYGIILSIYLYPFSFLISGIIIVIAIIIEQLLEPKIEEMFSDKNLNYYMPMTKERIEEILGNSHPKDWSYNDF